ncbi:MAG: hypothetical protein S4CHLAM81_15350 [Chlamydiales bacterium]|nr:hypothetical protein [Chlamydiales bacterium]MCH9636304.1 hypothetical protein [Chlamydiales bacterium]MCH9703969.1 hypothetical protein [Chlamydiota bacterium]
MSTVAQNSYIHKHLTDYRTGRVDVAEEKVLQWQAASSGDSLVQVATSPQLKKDIKSERLKLPTPGKSKSSGDTYTELAKAFGDISVAMGRALSGQSEVFALEEQGNTAMAKSMLIAQKNQIKTQKQVNSTIRHEEHEKKKEEKAEKISQIISYVTMGIIMVALPVAVAIGPAIMAAGSAAMASVSAAASTVCEIAADAVVSAAPSLEGIVTGADTTVEATEMTTFATQEAVEEGSTLSMTAFSNTSDATTDTATNATEESTQASESENVHWSRAKAVLKWLGKRALSTALSSIMGLDNLVGGIMDMRLSHSYKDLANEQSTLGTQISKAGSIRGAYSANQMNIKRQSSVIESMSQQSGQVVSTFADMMRTVRESSNSIAYAA